MVDHRIIREITSLQSSLSKVLDELMVFSDTPIQKGAFYMRPNLIDEAFLKILPEISRYEEMLSQLDGEDRETVRDIVDVSILIRIGNLFYWKALSSEQVREYEKALEFYIRANQLKDDSILYLTIGSIYRKIGRSSDAKDWIESGYSRMKKRIGDNDLEKPPSPFIYYFPYPKGPPAASAETIPKTMTCPSCSMKYNFDESFCPFCGYRLSQTGYVDNAKNTDKFEDEEMSNTEYFEVKIQKLTEERDNLRLELQKLRQPPLFVGTIHSLLDNGKAIVKSSTGPLFAVVVDSSIPRDLLVPGAQVLLHQRNFAVLEVIPNIEYPDLESLREQLNDVKISVKTLLEMLNNQEANKKKD